MTVRHHTQYFYEGGLDTTPLIATGKRLAQSHAVGAICTFEGVVRPDTVDKKTVKAIEFTAYQSMANKEIDTIITEAKNKFGILSGTVAHSIGQVPVHETCLFVSTLSGHRAASLDATSYIIEALKKRVSVFGKEIFDDTTHQWKENKW